MIEGDFSHQPAMLVGTDPFLMGENTPSTLTMFRNPLYGQWQIENQPIDWEHVYGTIGFTYTQGMQTIAEAPSQQITEGKIRDDGTGNGHFTAVVPVTNLNQRLSNTEHIKIWITNDMVVESDDEPHAMDLLDTVYTFAPGEAKVWTFPHLVLSKGYYDVNVEITIIGGPIYDFVHAYLPPSLWQLFLGPFPTYPPPYSDQGWDFRITVPGDLTGDGHVDIFDIVPIAIAFGTMKGDPTYNPNADLNRDGHVDIFDIVKVALDFGWSCPPCVSF